MAFFDAGEAAIETGMAEREFLVIEAHEVKMVAWKSRT